MKILEKIFSLKNERDKKVLRLLGAKFSISKFKFQRFPKFKNSKPVIALQVNDMDKGGLEEVVLQLASDEKIREKYNPVIIAAQNNKGYLASVAKKRGIYTYSYFNNPKYIEKLIKKLKIKIVHFHYNIDGVEIYKSYGVKTIYTVHNNYIWFDEKSAEVRSRWYESMDKYIAVSTQVKEFFLKKFNVVNSKVEVIPNGIKYIETKDIKPSSKESFGCLKDDFVFLNVASFGVLKYQFALIKAISILKEKYPKIKLLIIGNVADKVYYRQVLDFIKETNTKDCIKILSYLPKDEVFRHLKAADCFVMTSISEGFSIAGLEAMLFNLPMVLTDIGGAHDIISNNDTGIVVPHAFLDLQKLDINNIIKDNENKIFHFDNVDKIVNAMENIYLNKEEWIKKAQNANKKVKEYFNVDRVCADYLKQYDKLMEDFSIDKFEEFLKEKEFEIAVFAPYPMKSKITEGWMSRIAMIDSLISNKKRIYFNPYPAFSNILISEFKNNEFEISISPNHPMFQAVIDLLVKYTPASYCHTLHMADYLVSNLNSGKIIVDIHGVTPEEEVMLGNPDVKEKYEKVEQEVLKHAKCCVMVTNAMKVHYKNKYPQIEPKKCIILPIVEKLNIDKSTENKPQNQENIILYSGACQAWQNLESMLELNLKLDNDFKFIYLSRDFKLIKKRLKKLKIKNAKSECVSKEELKEIYKKANFGLMLRDKSPVNFVACPTKLYDYFSCGIIPVVRYSDIGDFLELGYKFIKEEDLLNKKIPSPNEQKEIIKNNFITAKKLRLVFEQGCLELKEFLGEKHLAQN